jgi:hypothetical protein
MNNKITKSFRRIDAAIHAFCGKEVHWNKNGMPCEIVRTSRGTFKKQDIPTIFPHWSYNFATWLNSFNE